MSIFQDHYRLFMRLRNTCFRALFDRGDEGPLGYFLGDVGYYGDMWKMLKDLRGDTTFNLMEKEDIEQEIRCIWLQCWKVWDGKRDLEEYLRVRTMWGMRDWVIKQSRVVTQYPYYYFLEDQPDFLLDLNFLLYGTRVYPFSTLTPYERYLLFLKYREEKSLNQIAKIVCKRRDGIQKELRALIKKLRRLSNEEENPIGPGSGGDGCSPAPGDNTEGCRAWNRDASSEIDQRDSRSASQCS